jgi:hypothetical protein
MIFKSSKLAGIWLALTLMMCFSVSASASPNPIAKAGSASKTVLVKTYDGAKSVAKIPVRFTKDAANGVWNVSDRLVTHVKSAF